MGQNIPRTKGRPQSYKFDRGGAPTEFGPYIGIVKQNTDDTRSGTLRVYIEQFGGIDPDNDDLWRTVHYISPFYGITPLNNSSTTAGVGNYKGNRNSYGMWFTPPDLGVSVICFFVEGDPNQGYYIGCLPEPGLNHMIPAIGASRKYETQNADQKQQAEFEQTAQLPVVEINTENLSVKNNPRFFTLTKPVHSYVFSILSNQGLLSDYIRGPISSSSQRETPSSAFGISTPGRAIYQGGLDEKTIKQKVDSGELSLADVRVEGRRGGHSLVMDDGDLQGRDNLIRIRTAKGHQITMSDEADCFYIIAANGQTWIELGSEGTVDVFSTNSVNVRSLGEINLHADKNININAGENLNIRAGNIQIESQNTTKITSVSDTTIYSKSKLGLLSDGTIALQSAQGGWKTSGALSFKAQPINLNSGAAPDSVDAPGQITQYNLDDTKFDPGNGWAVQPGTLETIVPRAPTHEPYPYHNRGVPVDIQVAATTATPATTEVTKALATVNNIPIVEPKTSPTAGLTPTSPISAGVPAGVAAGVSSADILTTPVADIKVGSLSKADVTGLLAQTKSAVGQASNAISVNKGIGQYGFTPAMLESRGLLKQGTLSQLNATPTPVPTSADIAEAQRINAEGGNITPQEVAKNRKVNSMLASPTLWTGVSGVSNLGALLNNSKLQSTVQQTALAASLVGLSNSGLATPTMDPKKLSGLVQASTSLGVGNVDKFVNGIAPPDIAGAVGATIKGAQFSTNFVTQKIGSFTQFSKSATSATDTVDRTAVDQGVDAALGDNKIPTPEFKPAVRLPDQPSALDTSRDRWNQLYSNAQTFLDGYSFNIDTLLTDVRQIEQQANPSLSEVNALLARQNTLTLFYSSNKTQYIDPLESLLNSTTNATLKAEFTSSLTTLQRQIKLLLGILAGINEILNEVKARAA
jgi:hypothetical protein